MNKSQLNKYHKLFPIYKDLKTELEKNIYNYLIELDQQIEILLWEINKIKEINNRCYIELKTNKGLHSSGISIKDPDLFEIYQKIR